LINISYSQKRTFFSPDKTSFWVPVSFSGEFRTYTYYRSQNIYRDFLTESQKSTLLSVGGLINSKSYIWDKNFLLLDFEAEYNPDLIRENFIVVPDHAETRTTKRVDLKTTFFNNKIITVSTKTNFSQTYNNREYLTNIKTDRKYYGGMFSFNNKILPFYVCLDQTNWDQEETETGRLSDFDHFNLRVRTSKSFYSRDKHDFLYSHNEYLFNRYGSLQLRTISDYFSLNDVLCFDECRNYNFQSRISYKSEEGTNTYDRFSVYEKLNLILPLNFKYNANYIFGNTKQELQNTAFHNVLTNLSHQLYLSLNTGIFYNYKRTIHSYYDETRNIYGGHIYYSKNIPLRGRLKINYNYSRESRENNSEPVSVQVIDENHMLTDGEIVLLDRPFIEVSTIVVRDLTGAILYQENLDYILIERNNYIEIQRFPGGQIADGDAILVDYVVNQPETYSYDADNHRFSASVSFLDRFVEVYYKLNDINYVNLTNTELLSLNYYRQNIYGIKFDHNYATAGFEFDEYNSNIFPYRLKRYYATFNKSFNDRIIVSLNANLRDYYLVNEDINRIYADVSTQAVYRIFDLTKASLKLGYRKQIGSGVDLDLITARLELTSQLRQLFLTLGFEKYNRDFMEDVNNYNGIYFRLVRKF